MKDPRLRQQQKILDWLKKIMSQATPPGGREQGQQKARPPSSLPVEQLIAEVFGWWRAEQHLGQGLGFIRERLHYLDLKEAWPSQPPARELIEPQIADFAYDAGTTERLRNANLWAAALETHIGRDSPQQLPQETMLTTYGFARIHGRVQLAVIHYLQPFAAFLAPLQQPIAIMGWRFPVVIRPWLPAWHSGSQAADGNCWVKSSDEAGRCRPGVLTARHAILPQGAQPPTRVHANVSRVVPSGRLQYVSVMMDAAVVAVEEREWGKKKLIQPSRNFGYKPVRLITGRRTIEADVVEHPGFRNIIFAEAGKEPWFPARVILNKHLEPGDSGCLGLDIEFEQRGQPSPPYLIYLGKGNFGFDKESGLGQLVEQPGRVWNLEFYLDASG